MMYEGTFLYILCKKGFKKMFRLRGFIDKRAKSSSKLYELFEQFVQLVWIFTTLAHIHCSNWSHCPQVDVQRFVRPLPKKQETTDMTPQLDCEYILETAERGQSRIYHTRLTILKRPANDEYIGELYVERDYREEEKKGSTCR